MDIEANAANIPAIEKPKKDQKGNRARQKNRQKKSASNAERARDTARSIKCGFSPLSVSIDLHTFTQAFFPEKHPPDYSRLHSISKLLVCQYVLHNQPDNNLQSYPFVFRLPVELHDCEPLKLRKKIQRKLSAALSRPILFWITRENDGGLGKTITHINGEILIHPQELGKLRQAFRELFGLRAINKAKNKPIQAHDDAITAKPMLPYAIRFPMASRNKQIANHGELYGKFNWCGYATKQELDRERERFNCRTQKKPMPDLEKFHHISKELNQAASEFYRANIQKK